MLNLFYIDNNKLRLYLKEVSGSELKIFLLVKSLYDEKGGPIEINYDEFQKCLSMARGTVANIIKKLIEKEYINRKRIYK